MSKAPYGLRTIIEQFHTATDLADCAVDAGETEQVPALLSRAEAMTGTDDGNLLLPEVSRLWRRIGNEKEAGSLDSKYLSYLTRIGGKEDLLICDAEPRNGVVTHRQTGMGADYSVVTIKTHYSFAFAALASHLLILEDKASICQRKGDPIAFAGTYGELKCSQPANHSGRLSFVSSGEPAYGVTIPPVQALPFKPVLDSPNLTAASPLSRIAGADRTRRKG